MAARRQWTSTAMLATVFLCLILAGPVQVDCSWTNPRPGCFGEPVNYDIWYTSVVTGTTPEQNCAFAETEYLTYSLSIVSGLMMLALTLNFFVPTEPYPSPIDPLEPVLSGQAGTVEGGATDMARGFQFMWHFQTVSMMVLINYSSSNFTINTFQTLYEFRWVNIWGDAPFWFGIDKDTQPYTSLFVGNVWYVCVGWMYIAVFYIVLLLVYFVFNTILMKVRNFHRGVDFPIVLHPFRVCVVYMMFSYQGIVATSTRVLTSDEWSVDNLLWLGCAGGAVLVTFVTYFSFLVYLTVKFYKLGAYSSSRLKFVKTKVSEVYKYHPNNMAQLQWKCTVLDSLLCRRGIWRMRAEAMAVIGHVSSPYAMFNGWYLAGMMITRLMLSVHFAMSRWYAAIVFHLFMSVFAGLGVLYYTVLQPFIYRPDNVIEACFCVYDWIFFTILWIFSIKKYDTMGLTDDDYNQFDAAVEVLIVAGMLLRIAVLQPTFWRAFISTWIKAFLILRHMIHVWFSLFFMYDDHLMRALGRTIEGEAQHKEEEQIRRENIRAKKEARELKLKKLKNKMSEQDQKLNPYGSMASMSMSNIQNAADIEKSAALEAAAADGEGGEELMAQRIEAQRKETWLEESRIVVPVRLQLTLLADPAYALDEKPLLLALAALADTNVANLHMLEHEKTHLAEKKKKPVSEDQVLKAGQLIVTPREGLSDRELYDKYLVFMHVDGETLVDAFTSAQNVTNKLKENKGRIHLKEAQPNKQVNLFLQSAAISSDHDQYVCMIDVSVSVRTREKIHHKDVSPQLAVALDIDTADLTVLRVHHQQLMSQIIRYMVVNFHDHTYRILKDKAYINSELTSTSWWISKVRILGIAEAVPKNVQASSLIGTFGRMVNKRMSVADQEPLKDDPPFKPTKKKKKKKRQDGDAQSDAEQSNSDESGSGREEGKDAGKSGRAPASLQMETSHNQPPGPT